jgi:hypothetical protein
MRLVFLARLFYFENEMMSFKSNPGAAAEFVSRHICHSEVAAATEESLFDLVPRKEREILRSARNDKNGWGVFSAA